MAHSDFPEAPEYALQRLLDALASDERVNALDLDARIVGDEVTLLGCVQTSERRVAVEAVAHRVLNGYRILNEVDVAELDGSHGEPSVDAIRVAAVGDIHFGTDSHDMLRKHCATLANEADVLLIAGDLTRHGTEEEAAVLAQDLENIGVPVVLVLGNHDHHSEQPELITKVLEGAGVTVLEGTSTVLEIKGFSVGIAGTKGFGGGFPGACGSDFGEPMMKAFMNESKMLAASLGDALGELDTDIRLALTHYAPIDGTLRGEKPEIYGWLGSYHLAEAIDAHRVDMAFHGHAHGGTEGGMTPGGVPVRNVAQPVIGQPYKVYSLTPQAELAPVAAIGSYAR